MLTLQELYQKPELLSKYVGKLTSPVIISNLITGTDNAFEKIKLSYVINISGTKVGIVGFVADIQGVTLSLAIGSFSDEFEAIQEECERLNQQGVKIVIALGSGSYDHIISMARKVPSLDIIVSGQNNFFLWNREMGPPPEKIQISDSYPKVVDHGKGKTLIVQVPNFARYIGQLNVTFDNNGEIVSYSGQPIFLRNSFPKDPDMEELLASYMYRVKNASKNVLATAKITFEGSNDVCSKAECCLGNFLTDTLISYVTQNFLVPPYWTIAPIAIVLASNFGHGFNPLENGYDITLVDILDAFPYNERVVLTTVKGVTLIGVLENSFSKLNEEEGFLGFAQVSGIRVVADPDKPVGSRIVTARARCGNCTIPRYIDIFPDKDYNIITFEVILAGVHGHDGLRNAHSDPKPLNIAELDIVIWYLKKYKRIHPQIDGRITILKHVQTSSASMYMLQMFTVLAYSVNLLFHVI